LVQRVVYHPIQDRVVEHLRRAGRRRVLDVGCGTGILATRIRDELEPDVVYGCDLSAGMLAQAEARSSGVHWLNSRAECLPLRAGAVDAVVSSAAFHFFDQRAALAEFHRVLSPGGFIVIAVPSPFTPAGSQILASGMRPLGTARFPTQGEMRRQVEASGFTVVTRDRAGGLRRVVDPTVVTVAVRSD